MQATALALSFADADALRALAGGGHFPEAGPSSPEAGPSSSEAGASGSEADLSAAGRVALRAEGLMEVATSYTSPPRNRCTFMYSSCS